jgi:hypothetical protein
MEWLFPSVVATLVGTLILTVIYFYLYIHDKQKFLLIWGVGWLVYACRFIFMLLLVSGVFKEFKIALIILNQLCVLASGIILLKGTFVFVKREIPRLWYLLSLVIAVWIITINYLEIPFLAQTLPTYLFLGIIYIWTGVVIMKHHPVKEEKRVTGWAFVLWGFHKMDFPFLRPVIWFAPWGYLIGATLEMVVAMGMLLVYFKQSRCELEESRIVFKKVKIVSNNW